LKQAFDLAFARAGTAIGKTDQENARLAERIAGSFAIMTLLQIRGESLRVHVVPIDGTVPTADDAARGLYPFPIQVCFVRRPDMTPAALGFLDFLRTETARRIIADRAAAPVM
jgi:hypothetical protein